MLQFYLKVNKFINNGKVMWICERYRTKTSCPKILFDIGMGKVKLYKDTFWLIFPLRMSIYSI